MTGTAQQSTKVLVLGANGQLARIELMATASEAA